MLADNNIIKATKIQKVKHWYQDLKTMEVNLHYTSDLQTKQKCNQNLPRELMERHNSGKAG